MAQPSLIEITRKAWAAHRPEAEEAYALFRSYVRPHLICVPGMDTVLRLAVRIDCGKSIEEAAAKEYLYRWGLALQSRVFDVPHLLGPNRSTGERLQALAY